LRHGQEPFGRTGVAGNKDQLILFRPGWRPMQVMVEMDGLVVLADPEKGDVEVVAEINEIVGIAADKCGVKLGREHQAHVGVLLLLVEVVDLAE